MGVEPAQGGEGVVVLGRPPRPPPLFHHPVSSHPGGHPVVVGTAAVRGLPPIGSQTDAHEAVPGGKEEGHLFPPVSPKDQAAPCLAGMGPDAEPTDLEEVRQHPVGTADPAGPAGPVYPADPVGGPGVEGAGAGQDAGFPDKATSGSVQVIVDVSHHRPAAEKEGKCIRDLHAPSVAEATPGCRS